MATLSGAGLSEEKIQVRNRGRGQRQKDAEHSCFLVEPLVDETKERLCLALEQLRVILMSERLIASFALHQLIVELAFLILSSER